MRHNVKKNTLSGKSRSHRNAVVRNLATSLILHERIKTTAKKAKVAAPVVEKLITIAKTKDTMNAIRQINAVVYDKNASKKLIEVLKDRYSKRDSGYTRVTKFKNRDGDNAPLVVLELVDAVAAAPAKEEEKAPAKKAAAKKSTEETKAEKKEEAKEAPAKKAAAKKEDK